jgi:flavin-dependent dehydrogenase
LYLSVMDSMKYDVAIIGGGPGGSSAAIYLRQKGYSVVLLEKDVFPRDHVGESLIPFTYYKLRELGVWDDILKFATKKPGVNFVDKDGERQSVWCFDRILHDGAQMSVHTLRAPFDHAILKQAVKSGANVHEGVKVTNVDLRDPESVTVFTDKSEIAEIKARFLIDATGQNSFLGNKLKLKVPYESLDRVALFSHWINTRYDGALAGGLIKIIYLGGEKLGWIWVIPVGRNHLSIGVTLNNSYVREQKKNLGENWQEQLYKNEIAQAVALRPILEGAQIEHQVQVISDYSYRIPKKYGPNFALVGDSAAFLDPIFSSGVYVAMEIADRVSQCLDAKFKNGKSAGDEAFEMHYAHIEKGYALIEKFVRLFYQPERLNFSHADASHDAFRKFVNAYDIFHYLLSGDFFSQPDKYSAFIDEMDEGRTYHKFIHFVRDKAKEYPDADYCKYSFDEMYGHLPHGDQVAPGLLGSH